MKVASKLSLWLLLLYLPAVIGLIFWLYLALEASTESLMEQTATLIGREIATAARPELLEQLRDHPGDGLSLRRELQELVGRSQLLEAVTVVEADGTVIASDEPEVRQRQLPAATVLFGDDPRARLVSRSSALARGDFILEVPLLEDNLARGYLRLSLRSATLGELYVRGRQRLLIAATVSTLLLAGLAFALHLQLARGGRRLTEALAAARRGQSPPASASGRPNEFTSALEVAGQLGLELAEERQRGEVAGRHLDELARVMDVGILLLDADGEPQRASGRARELLGLSPGGDAATTLAEELREAVGALVAAARRSGRAATDLVRLQTDSGERRLQCQVYPITADGGGPDGYLLLLRDAASLEALESSLLSAAQLKSMARLYLGMAHDLKAPLHALHLNLELLRRSLSRSDDEPDDERRRQWLQVLHDELGRLGRGLDALLDQAAPPSQERQRFDLRQLAEELAELLAAQARQQQVHLELDNAAEPLPIEASRDLLKQATLTLAVNALEAMPDGGELTLVTRADGNLAALAVRDTGPGVAPELQRRIFDLHFTTKQTGTGVGLHVARSIAGAVGGQLEIAATGPEGTTFELRLPRLPGEEA